MTDLERVANKVKNIYDNCKYPEVDLEGSPNKGFYLKVANYIMREVLKARIDELEHTKWYSEDHMADLKAQLSALEESQK